MRSKQFLLLCFTLVANLFQTSVAIEIIPLTMVNSVIHVEGITKYVPASYQFACTSIKFGELYCKMHDGLNIFQATIGHYEAQGDHMHPASTGPLKLNYHLGTDHWPQKS
jgi:hypothetical protein